MEQSNYQESSNTSGSGERLFRFNGVAIARILSEGLDFNLIFALESEALCSNIDNVNTGKFGNWRETLIRKQFLTKEGKLSTKGAALLEDLGGMTGGMSTYTPAVDLFSVWWNTYPPTAAFTHKGRTFESEQVKRIKKMECRKYWDEILLEGEFTAEQIIQGTKNHFEVAMDESVRKGENRVQFINNSLIYIREKLFAPFIERKKGSRNIDTIDI